MYNALKLDWLALKGNKKNIAFQIAIILLFGMFMSYMLLPYLCLIVAMICMNIFAVEEKSQLENLYMTLPLDRKNILQARYVFSLITFVTTIIVSLIGYALCLKFGYKVFDFDINVGVSGLAFVISLLYLGYSVIISILYPILFKYGITKSRKIYILLLACIFGFFGLVSGITGGLGGIDFLLDVYYWIESNLILVLAMMLTLGTLVLYISYEISLKIYRKRDF
jgi:ABC-type transport system involved in multi-copper enzyme maturation permease subunit